MKLIAGLSSPVGGEDRVEIQIHHKFVETFGRRGREIVVTSMLNKDGEPDHNRIFFLKGLVQARSGYTDRIVPFYDNGSFQNAEQCHRHIRPTSIAAIRHLGQRTVVDRERHNAAGALPSGNFASRASSCLKTPTVTWEVIPAETPWPRRRALTHQRGMLINISPIVWGVC
jgi:hypothetical protein